MVAAARDIRETFARMAMNDEETVALIAGGHTFGKCHGAAEPGPHVGPEPEGAGVENQGLGWINSFGGGRADDTITSGLEGAWTTDPPRWDNNYFENLFGYEWELIKGPGGAHQWAPQGGAAADAVRDAHDPSKRHAPMMLTTDLALRVDPNYTPIARRFHADPAAFADAFARAWFKLTHRDMGSVERYLGPPVPAESLIWQDPVPPVDHDLIGDDDIAALKGRLLPSGLSVSRLVATAWASASTHRDSDKRGSANGARIRLAPQKDWAVNEPTELATALRAIEAIQSAFHGARTDGKRVSMADLIVLGGCAAIERAAKSAGYDVRVPFTPGRTDATQVQTDIHAFAALEPFADGCRNYIRDDYPGAPADLLLDRANLLTLTAPEMTVLLGGLRALNANVGGAPHGVFTDRPGVLTHDVLVNLLDMVVVWRRSGADAAVLEGRDRETGDLRWTGSVVDLVFGSNAQLRAIAEVYAAEDAREVFVRDFVAAWAKVMNLGRFDLA